MIRTDPRLMILSIVIALFWFLCGCQVYYDKPRIRALEQELERMRQEQKYREQAIERTFFWFEWHDDA